LSAYLDTSVLLPTLIAEPSTESVYDYLGAINQELLISDFAAAEVASALSRLIRMTLLTDADASARLADFDA
jgi:predicted nucleic acid-binding protein